MIPPSVVRLSDACCLLGSALKSLHFFKAIDFGVYSLDDLLCVHGGHYKGADLDFHTHLIKSKLEEDVDMPDAVSLNEQLNHISVQLLLTDADIALTFLNVAEETHRDDSAEQAIRDARRAYDVICQKLTRFRFSKREAKMLGNKLQQIKARLMKLESRHGE